MLILFELEDLASFGGGEGDGFRGFTGACLYVGCWFLRMCQCTLGWKFYSADIRLV